ncbi:hypothetical protein Scep_009453 [Stephania cephalantha]|uniref:Uncharacterized protein n=1 Tax=Stephania cephalantha TaxID=152367 RepID=A0AAP0JVP3_9MAGN
MPDTPVGTLTRFSGAHASPISGHSQGRTDLGSSVVASRWFSPGASLSTPRGGGGFSSYVFWVRYPLEVRVKLPSLLRTHLGMKKENKIMWVVVAVVEATEGHEALQVAEPSKESQHDSAVTQPKSSDVPRPDAPPPKRMLRNEYQRKLFKKNKLFEPFQNYVKAFRVPWENPTVGSLHWMCLLLKVPYGFWETSSWERTTLVV